MFKKLFTFGILFILFTFTLSGSILAIGSNQTKPSNGEIFLYTGSPLILCNGKVKMLDPVNPDIGATVVQSRTLLPLRALSEYFGAEVTYDQAEREAIINYNGKRYFFPIGDKKYLVEEEEGTKEFAMDSQSMLLSGRTMVPLRVICENVLGKKVSYYNRVIAVADYEVNLQKDAELMKDVGSKIGEAVKAGTRKELELALSGNSGFRAYEGAAGNGIRPAVREEQSTGENVKSQSDGAYSATNIQVEGIDEGDIVKTDGKYIYIAGNNVVRIIGADQGELSDDTAIRLARDKNVSEIYLSDNRLVLLGTKWVNSYVRKGEPSQAFDEKVIGIMPPYFPAKSYSFADVYDITNPLRPVFIKSHEMEGSYQSSRKNGEILYLLTNTYPSGDHILPMMRDTAVSNAEFNIKLDDVMILPRHPASGYLIISAINVNNTEETEVEAITAQGTILYMNHSNLYLAYNNSDGYSSIIKFKLAGMKVGYAGSGQVEGYLLNQFSMDEYEGNLRVATTTWKNENGLYILDESLNLIGAAEGLAKGESIYSVRFAGDKGYLVTFRNIDPLFVFDLSDPTKPAVTGELKIPGFSNYLHPVGQDLLLGIGADTYEIYRKDSNGNDIVIGTRQGGIKYSLFDISDMGKPKEISKYVIGDSGSNSEAFYNHKAIMVDETSQQVALDAFLTYENQEKGSRQGAVIISYGGKKLSLRGILDSTPSGVYGNDIPYARRVLYIGDVLYYVQDGCVASYDYDSLKQIDMLVLQ